MSTIFISHSAADEPVVDDFFDLLQTGCDMRRAEIFCSSVEGAGIKTGQDFIKWIHRKIAKCKLVVLFLTPNFYASKFCVAEMGAAWALKKDVFPLVVPGMKRDAGVVMLGKQTAIVDESGLDNLRDHIITEYPDAGKSTSKWNLKKEQFLNNFRKKVSNLPIPQLVDQALLAEEQEKTAAAMEMNDDLTENIRKLRKQIKKLEKAKDSKEVDKIRSEFTDETKHYDELVKEAKKHLNKLSWVESRCVYASIRDELWVPSEYDYREERKSIERAIQSEAIDEYDNSSYEASSSHPRMSKVFDALYELDNFIDEELSAETIEDMVGEKGHYIDIRNREYWDEELDQTAMPD